MEYESIRIGVKLGLHHVPWDLYCTLQGVEGYMGGIYRGGGGVYGGYIGGGEGSR